MEKEILEVVEQALEQKEQEQEIQTLTEKINDIDSSYVSRGEFIFNTVLLSILISLAVFFLCSSFLYDEFLKLEKRLEELESCDNQCQ